jgi:RNA polymerase sigma-70 factor (ECF subfamily)
MDYAAVASASSLAGAGRRLADLRGLASPEARAVAERERARDAGWIDRARQGDGEAFRRLVEQYQERAYRIALGVMGSREEAWDVSQEAFLRVYRSLDRFQLGQNFYTWLYRIVVNLSIDALRKRSQDRAVALEELGDAVGVHCPPGRALDDQELRVRVKAVLECLPAKYRVVLVLRDVEELGCWEIAKVVGCTHATARWRLHKARQMFRDSWERHLRRARSPIPETDRRENGDRSRRPAFDS